MLSCLAVLSEKYGKNLCHKEGRRQDDINWVPFLFMPKHSNNQWEDM